MKERRKRIMKRLLIEELERREMLTAVFPAMQSSGITTGSYEDVYRSEVGTEMGGPGGVGMVGNNLTERGSALAPAGSASAASVSTAPSATTGTGQMTITTGANTLGIGSFATPTVGPSRAGGTGNIKLGQPSAQTARAADAAIESLTSDREDWSPDKGPNDSKPAPAPKPTAKPETRGTRGDFGTSDLDEAAERQPVGAGSER